MTTHKNVTLDELLLTSEERDVLRRDLREIARCRRRGESEAACLPMA